MLEYDPVMIQWAPYNFQSLIRDPSSAEYYSEITYSFSRQNNFKDALSQIKASNKLKRETKYLRITRLSDGTYLDHFDIYHKIGTVRTSA